MQIYESPKGYYYDHESVKEQGANGKLRNRRSVWSLQTEPFNGAHFAVFPTKLIEPCVLAGSEEGDYVLDPFFGSGTTGLVATLLKRNFLGIEIKQEYITIAMNRLGSYGIVFEAIPVRN